MQRNLYVSCPRNNSVTFTNIFSTIINSLNPGVTCNSVYWFDRPGERIPQKISISWAEVIIRVKCHHQSQLSLVRQISSTVFFTLIGRSREEGVLAKELIRRNKQDKLFPLSQQTKLIKDPLSFLLLGGNFPMP